jgi:hypothetical protein
MGKQLVELLANGEEQEARDHAWRALAQDNIDLAAIVKYRGKGGSKAQLLEWARSNNMVAVGAVRRSEAETLTAEDREAMKIAGIDEDTYRSAKKSMLEHADGSVIRSGGGKASVTPSAGGRALSEGEQALCRHLGISGDEYLEAENKGVNINE